METKYKKKSFVRLLDNFEENKDYWVYSNKEYIKYYEKSMDKDTLPHPNKFKGKNKTNHLILTVDCFKQTLLMLNNSKVGRIRKHFIQMEKLLLIYWKYQCIFKELNFQDEINKLKQLQHIKQYTQMNAIIELDNKIQEKYKIGCVYFIYEENDMKYFKIGYTFNLKSRLCELQVGNRRKLKIYKTILCQFPEWVESYLHNKFNYYNEQGEWFNIIKLSKINEQIAIFQN